MAADAENDRYVSVKSCISFGIGENQECWKRVGVESENKFQM